jgi:predicted transcriptional regulator
MEMYGKSLAFQGNDSVLLHLSAIPRTQRGNVGEQAARVERKKQAQQQHRVPLYDIGFVCKPSPGRRKNDSVWMEMYGKSLVLLK